MLDNGTLFSHKKYKFSKKAPVESYYKTTNLSPSPYHLKF